MAPSLSALSFSGAGGLEVSAWAQSLRLEHRDGGWCGQELDQGLGGTGLLGVGGDGGRIDGVELELRRQRPEQLGALIGKDLADLRNSEFGFAIGDRLGGRIAGRLDLELGLNLVGDAE